jgi:hypothetical protein
MLFISLLLYLAGGCSWSAERNGVLYQNEVSRIHPSNIKLVFIGTGVRLTSFNENNNALLPVILTNTNDIIY